MTGLTTGQRIAQCRKNQNLSQEALGERMGVSRQAVSKWEADAVMPDVDKLIGLSKLFCVSVGWLLGVEESECPVPEAPSESQVSEELLRKIEQIVLKYQPVKKPLARWKKLLLVLLALVAGWNLLSHYDRLRSELQNTNSQVSSINSQNSKIQNQLNALNQRLDSLNTTMEQAAASLASYDFTLIPDVENQTVQVEVDIVPKTWNEGSTAFLSVRRDGEEIQSQACHWDGTALYARPQLPMEDGFAYWLVVRSAEGNQESIPLVNEPAQQLYRSFHILCDVNPEIISYENSTLRVSLDNFYLYRPEPETDPEQWQWGDLYFFVEVCRVGKPIGYALTFEDPEFLRDQFIEQWGHTPVEFSLLDTRGVTFNEATEPLELRFGDTVEFWVMTSLKNDVSYAQSHGKWMYDGGEFVPVT